MVDQYGHKANEKYTFLDLNVAGVTFKNGRRHRQTILRQIFWKDEPYQRIKDGECLDFVVTEYEGEPAVEIWVKNKKAREMIGYVPKKEAKFFADNIDQLDEYYDFEVYGGGEIGGKKISFGASFVARFRNTEKTILQESEFEKAERERKEREEQEKKQQETEARRKEIQRKIEAEEAARKAKTEAKIKNTAILVGIVIVIVGIIVAGWK